MDSATPRPSEPGPPRTQHAAYRPSGPAPAGLQTDLQDLLLAQATEPGHPLTLAFAGVIGRAHRAGQRPLIRGLAQDDFQRLLDRFFPGVRLDNGGTSDAPATVEEFEDLRDLLLEYRQEPSETLAWLAQAVASAAMRDNHLWQDMGLPNRALLSHLLLTYFPDLAGRNVGDMKWKKFFYRQLCERAQVPICKSPNCADCVDYQVCFGHDH